MDRLEPAAIARVASAALDLSAFADEVLERAARAVGFDVAYHAIASADGSSRFAARRGFSDAVAQRLLDRGEVYGRELAPVKAAAHANGGVAVDSEVLSSAARSRLRYSAEAMAPDGGRHAMIVLGCFAGSVASVTMLGRTGSPFARADVEAMRAVAPLLGIATAAHARRVAPPPPRTPLGERERDLVDYVALGLTNADIALARGASPRTVRNQLSALYAKLGVANRAELVAVAGERSSRDERHRPPGAGERDRSGEPSEAPVEVGERERERGRVEEREGVPIAGSATAPRERRG